MHDCSTRKPEAKRSLISRTTILILSAFLVGVTIGKGVAEDISPYVLTSGLVGVLAFLCLDSADATRRERRRTRKREKVVSRLERHVPPSALDKTALDAEQREAEREPMPTA